MTPYERDRENHIIAPDVYDDFMRLKHEELEQFEEAEEAEREVRCLSCGFPRVRDFADSHAPDCEFGTVHAPKGKT